MVCSKPYMLSNLNLTLMKGYLLPLALYIAVFFSGCTSSTSELPFKNVEYVTSFPHVFELKGGEEVETNLIGIQDIMLCDSVMLLATSNANGFISAYSLKTGQIVGNYFKRGNGPGELLFAPYFSSMNKCGEEEDSGLVFNDRKGHILKWIFNGFADSKPEIMCLRDSVPSSHFYSLYINDSTFVCREINNDASGQNRYIFSQGKRTVTGSMSKLNALSIPAKGDGYMFNILSSFSRYSKSEDLIIEASLMLNTIYMYSLDGSFEKVLCLGKKADDIASTYYGGFLSLKNTFKRLMLYDGLFAVSYCGGKQDPMPFDIVPKTRIYMFDYSGKPLAELELPDKSSSFDIDWTSGFLYTFEHGTESVRRYDISHELDAIKSSL